MAFFGVPLSQTAQARFDAGAPLLTLAEVGHPEGLEPGRPLRLMDRFAETVAAGVADPENDVVRLWTKAAVRAFDAGFFRQRVGAAWALRRAAGVGQPGPGETEANCLDEAFRLVNSEGDGLCGLTADVYGAYAVVCAPSRGLLPYGRLLAEAVVAGSASSEPRAVGEPRIKGAVVKIRGKDPQDKSGKDEIIGERPPDKLVVRELGVPFEVHLVGSLNVGLFTDMREHRRGLARFVRGRRVLNTFAYTGALSVAAARAGAAAVTSVDLSSGVLAWARENFRLSGLDPADPRYAFEVSDVRRYLTRAREEGTQFDLVILDPPTVSAARASQWSMKKDYPDLIAAAARLIPLDGGLLWASSNARKSSTGTLAHLTEGLRRAGRVGAILEEGGLPPDYPTLPTWSEGRYLDVVLAWVGGLA